MTKTSDTLGPVDKTNRGFETVKFLDRYGCKCSLQMSSLIRVVSNTSSGVLKMSDIFSQFLRPATAEALVKAVLPNL